MTVIEIVQYPGIKPKTSISPPCWKVHLGCRFKGLEYTVTDVMLPHQVKRANPRGRMPAARFGDSWVVDSSDILTALDQRYPDKPMMLESPRQRAETRILEDWADENLYFYGVYLRWNVKANLKRLQRLFFAKHLPFSGLVTMVAKRDLVKRIKGQGVGLKSEAVVREELNGCLQALEDWLGDQDWLVGERMSRADIAVYALIDQLSCADLTPTAAASLQGFGAISGWRGRCRERVGSINDDAN